MISSHLQGGLGNQMFQIAAAHALALRNNTASCFDLAGCYTPLQGNPSTKYRNNILSKITQANITYYRDVYYEPNFSYSEIPNKKNLVLSGYFQSEKYFSDYKKEIIDLFDMSESKLVSDYLLGFRKMNVPVTAVHVRRGDYLKNQEYHPVCSVEYYTKAMTEIGESNFIFISDDMEWVKE